MHRCLTIHGIASKKSSSRNPLRLKGTEGLLCKDESTDCNDKYESEGPEYLHAASLINSFEDGVEIGGSSDKLVPLSSTSIESQVINDKETDLDGKAHVAIEFVSNADSPELLVDGPCLEQDVENDEKVNLSQKR